VKRVISSSLHTSSPGAEPFHYHDSNIPSLPPPPPLSLLFSLLLSLSCSLSCSFFLSFSLALTFILAFGRSKPHLCGGHVFYLDRDRPGPGLCLLEPLSLILFQPPYISPSCLFPTLPPSLDPPSASHPSLSFPTSSLPPPSLFLSLPPCLPASLPPSLSDRVRAAQPLNQVLILTHPPTLPSFCLLYVFA
jgi:hypothetical protein